MKIFVLPPKMVDALRAWFHPKDRSVILAPATFIEGEEIVTPAHPTAPGNPAHNRGRLYWKDGYWTQLNEDGDEQILTGPALIAETVLSGNATSVTFSGIPQIFRHLMLIIQARSSAAAEGDVVLIRFNNDSGNNYDQQRLSAAHTTVSGAASRAGTSILAAAEAANSRANNFASQLVHIIGYSRSDAEKWAWLSTVNFGDVSADTDMGITFRAGRWRNTTPISSITISPSTGPNFVSGSQFQLYGIS